MADPTPPMQAAAQVRVVVMTNGHALDPAFQIVSIELTSGIGIFPTARLVFLDGSPEDGTFPVSESNDLIPGTVLTVSIGHGELAKRVFSGVVYRHGIEVAPDAGARLIVEATDKAMAMSLARGNAIFENTGDDEVCARLIAEAGCKPQVSPIGVRHDRIVQYDTTAWDMVLTRAAASGMVVTVENGTVTVAPPDTSAPPVLELRYGESILSLNATMDAATQFDALSIEKVAWDPARQLVVASDRPSSSAQAPGDISSAALASVFGVRSYPQTFAGDWSREALTRLASSALQTIQLSKIRGTVAFFGSTLVNPGCMVRLAGLGARFNGDAYVSAVRHTIADGDWRTEIDIGMPPLPPPGAAEPLGGHAVQPGIVKQIDADPEGGYRVLVSLPLLQAPNDRGVWARFGSSYASDRVGISFFPEIGDEVAVGFLGGDPRYPVVLGSLHSKAKPPPNPPDSGNSMKSIVTKSGLRIDFAEDRPSVSIATPGGQTIQLDDRARSVKMTDRNGNRIAMDDKGVRIESAADLRLSARGRIDIDPRPTQRHSRSG